uniref:F-box domain-containing protein n=1 Tax=Glossina brevipalpis TaxID=37001 RepID=A0A1A9X500_9MUSC
MTRLLNRRIQHKAAIKMFVISAPIPELPNEMWLKIFNILSHGDLLQVNLVCKRWCQLTQARELKRKSKLVVTKENLKDICDLMENNDLKYENVDINDKRDEFSNVGHASVLKIFEYFGCDIVRLKLYKPSMLSLLNHGLPKLQELDLSCMMSDKIVPVNFNKFSNLKSLLLPPRNSESYLICQLSEHTFQMPKIRLEKLSLSVNDCPLNCLNVLATHASSLRWLQLYVPKGMNLTVQGHFQEIFRKFTQLEELLIDGVGNMEYRRLILEYLPKENPLKTIALSLTRDVDLVELIIQKWRNSLECLKLKYYHRAENTASQLNFMNCKLRSLEWYGGPLTPQEFLDCVATKTNQTLTELKLFSLHVTGEFFDTLFQRLPNLAKLDLRGVRITDEEMVYVFRHLTHLRHLSLDPCVSENGIEYLCSELHSVSNLKRLQTLQICLCPIKALQILNLNFKFKKLTKLVPQFCHRSGKLSVLTIVHISTYFPVLEELFVDRLNFDYADIQEIRKHLPRLHKLS